LTLAVSKGKNILAIYMDKEKNNIDDVQGFSSLLSFLEYGAYTKKGRKISDFGVPQNIIDHIEGRKTIIELDGYEKIIYEEIKK